LPYEDHTQFTEELFQMADKITDLLENWSNFGQKVLLMLPRNLIFLSTCSKHRNGISKLVYAVILWTTTKQSDYNFTDMGS
jgi:hypothetical protein